MIPLFDPPHLLKCVRNNLLEARAKFLWTRTGESEQLAAWSDIVKLYEMDTGDFDFRMLNNLTDCHIYREKMKKMKVSVAAQVFSQRVSSVMRGMVKYSAGRF